MNMNAAITSNGHRAIMNTIKMSTDGTEPMQDLYTWIMAIAEYQYAINDVIVRDYGPPPISEHYLLRRPSWALGELLCLGRQFNDDDLDSVLIVLERAWKIMQANGWYL